MDKEIKTLKDLRRWAPMFGELATQWADKKIAESPIGEDEPVLAHDSQILFLLMSFTEREEMQNGKPI